MRKYIFLFIMAVAVLPLRAQTYEELIDKASKYEAKDSLAAAIKVYEQIISKDPNNAHNSMAYANMGRAQRDLGNTKGALFSYGKALDISPHSVTILMERATFYSDLNDYDHAIIDCNSIMNINKFDKDALNLRGYLYFKLKRYDEAKADYENILSGDVKDVGARIGLATVDEAQEKYHEALEIVNELIIERPGDPEMYYMRANLDKDLILYDYALMDIDKAIQVAVKPTVDMWVFRGDVQLHLKKKLDARQSYERAIKAGASRAALLDRIKKCHQGL